MTDSICLVVQLTPFFLMSQEKMGIFLILNVSLTMKFFIIILYLAVTPIATIKYWRSLVSSDIHLGDDVYFECEIRANPATYNVTWRHNVRHLEY